MPKLINLIEKRFGRLKVVERAETDKIKPYWKCECDCGNIIITSGDNLRGGDAKSCGCLRKDLLTKDLTGEQFGRLKVIEKAQKKGKSTAQFWKCVCDCGTIHIASSQHLRLGQTTSCGCITRKTEEELLKYAKERFWNNVRKTSTCWIWKGILGYGYGQLYYKGSCRAHRFSYLIHKGQIEKGKFICHTCDNPLCVNPDHLYQGTHEDNMKDKIDRKRCRYGERHHKTKLKKTDVYKIINSKEKDEDIAKRYSMSVTSISRIRNRKQWIL